LRRQLFSQDPKQTIPYDVMMEELVNICKQSETVAWTVDHLLALELPFIRELRLLNGREQ
jgi:hypothetical protein